MKARALLLFVPVFICAHALFSQVQVRSAKGTGRTTGHIIMLSVKNPGKKDITESFGPYFIPSDGKYQSYVVPGTKTATIPRKKTIDIPIIGYCTDIHRPPVPSGDDLPPYSDWVQVDISQPLSFDWIQKPGLGVTIAPPTGGPAPTIPGTDRPLGATLDIDARPDLAGPLLVSVVNKAGAAYDSLMSVGAISTPFSNNRERERESVIQQFTWYYTTALRGDEYTIEQFEERLTIQLEANAGKKKDELPPSVVEEFDAGVADFWNSFTLVGAEAKLISIPE
jgi:hypothetical protein